MRTNFYTEKLSLCTVHVYQTNGHFRMSLGRNKTTGHKKRKTRKARMQTLLGKVLLMALGERKQVRQAEQSVKMCLPNRMSPQNHS